MSIYLPTMVLEAKVVWGISTFDVQLYFTLMARMYAPFLCEVC